MDGLDELMREVQQTKEKSSNIIKKSSLQSPPALPSPPSDSAEAADLDSNQQREEINFLKDQLKEFMIDIADTSVQDYVNSSFKQIHYDRFVQYYLENASLSHYSIEAELNRMHFTVIYQHNQTTNKEEILNIFSVTQLDDLWRFANQSVYADLLVAIQHYYTNNNSELLISTVASSSHILVNLDDLYFEACCEFDFVVESDAAVKNRLKLGSIQGWVKINLDKKTLKLYVDSPRIPVVFDDDLRAAAKTILQSYYSQQDLENHSKRSLRSVISQYAGRVVQSIPSLPRASSLTTDATSEHLETSNVSTITESLLEGVVGSFGRWIGADKTASKGSNGSPLVELRAALNQNEELVSAHRKNTKPLDSVSPSDADLAKNIDDWEW